MSTNIKLKRSSVQGKVPLTTDLELGELAINTYDGKLYMKKNDGTDSIVDVTAGGSIPTLDAVTDVGNTTTNSITVGGITTTANAIFGDGVAATFGTGVDLQIYHDGTNSYIEDVGTGSLYIKSDGAGVAINGANNSPMVTAISGGAVYLNYNGSIKLGTTSTGVDVTGTITSDGLTANTVDATTLTGNLNWSYVTNKPDPNITVSLTGDVTGSANTTLTDLANGSISIATTIASNSVALGTDTTGNYMVNVVGTANEIEVSHTQGEGSTATIGLPDSVTITSNLTVGGDLTVSGNTVTINATNLAIEDNMIYLNEGSTVTNPDLGFSGNYNDGTYAHAGLFRDASDSGIWKFFQGYTPEPDANSFIDTTHASFALSNVQANTFIGALSGNATTATTLQTARTISLTGDVTGSASFDGSSNISIAATIASNSVALGADTTGNYVASITNGSYITGANGGSEGAALTLAVDATTTNTASKVVARDESGNFAAGTITAALSGNATTATTLQTARNIALTGAVTGNANFDGSGDISIATTATSDPTLTLAGDATGSATFTNLGNATLTVTVVDDSHTHDGRYYTETEIDTRMGYTLYSQNSAAGGDLNSLANYGWWNWGGTSPTNAPATYGMLIYGTDGSQPQQLVQTYGGTANQVSLYGRRKTGGTWDTSWTQYFSDHYHPNADAWTTARTFALTGDVTGSVSVDGSGDVSMATTIAANSVALGTDTTGNYMVNVSAGGGISVSHTQGEGSTATISHADTSSAANLTASGRTYVTGLTFDTYGHVTGYTTDTETVTDTNTTYDLLSPGSGVLRLSDSSNANDNITFVGSGATTVSSNTTHIIISSTDTNTTYANGAGIGLSGTTFSHLDTSTQASLTALTGANVVSDIDLDTYGHVTAIATRAMTLADLGYTGATNAQAGTITSIATSGAITGGTITTSGTISHSTADGYLHVPATGTTNNGKVLTAGATAGSLSWTTISATTSFDGLTNKTGGTGDYTTTGTMTAATFNATSTTNGGFQGIDADSLTAPSFTWTSDLNTGMWHRAADQIGFTTGGNDEFWITTTYTESAGSSRAPIFYDSNNTAYYVDAGGTSRLVHIYANGYYNGGLPYYTGPILTYTLTSGGSGYTDGTYTNQVLSGGSGVYATFDFTVSGGVVTVATITERGSGFYINNTIDIPALGGTGSGGLITVNTVRSVDMSLYSAAARIRLSSNDTTLAAGQEIGGIYFGTRDASAGGAGDKAYILGTAEGTSGGGKIEFWTSANGGAPTLCAAVGGSNDFRLYNTAGTFYHAFSNAPTANRTLTLPDATGTIALTSSSITGNAATATALQTARTINGVSFNGTANITITDSTKAPIASPTFTGTVTGPTFNATSTSGGGFQGIDADTVTAPSFTWTADLNTGIYRPAADQVGITCGGTNELTITTTTATFAGNVVSNSDLRLKKDIEKIDFALSKVKALNGVNFTKIKNGDRSTGLIAQDVKAVLPEAVSEDADGYLSVAYGNMVGLLVEAIKEQDDKINTMRNEIDELKNLVKQLMETR